MDILSYSYRHLLHCDVCHSVDTCVTKTFENMSLDVNISEPEEFNCVELHSCLKEVAGILGFNDFEYHVDHISGGRHENNTFRVVIRDSDTDADKSVSVIVKTLVNTTRQELFHDLHEREVNVYRQILPKFAELQEKLDKEERVSFPECLYSSADKTNQVIILKDLNDLGFILDDTIVTFEELNYRKIRLVLTELAKFHALSFVYDSQHSEEFAKIKDKFADVLFQDTFLSKSKLRNYFFESYDMSVNLVSNFDAKKKLARVRPKLLEALKMYNKPSQFNVLCHGDLWMNNILFKEENKKLNICFLDFQTVRYTSPANDIVYFMYLSTSFKFRLEYFSDLLSAYYDTLTSTLKTNNIDVDLVYPRKCFEEDIKDKLPLGLLTGLVQLRIIAMNPENDAICKGNKIITGSHLTEVPSEIELFKYKINDLVQESTDNGVLDQLIAKINV